jgi:hypothetical protein
VLSPGAKTVLRIGIALLALLGLSYHAKGHWYLLFGSGSFDLRQRYVEQRYVSRGQNPNDIAFQAWGVEPVRPTDRPVVVIPELASTPPVAGYPPWAFLTQYLFVWPPWPATRFYMSLLDIAAVAFIGAWAYRSASHLGREAGVAMAVACTACSAYSPGLQTGNYPLIVAALLAATLLLETANRHVAAGLTLGVAMIKPHMAGPFVVGALCRGRYVLAAVTTAYITVASLIVSWLVKTSPVEMVQQMLKSSTTWVDQTAGPVALALAAGLAPSVATAVTAVVFVGIGAALHWRFRRLDALTHFAIAGLVARLFTYHRVYDDLLLIFLLLALGLVAMERRSRSAGFAFLLVGLSLWPPARLTDLLAFQVFQIAAWCTGLATLLTLKRANPVETTMPATHADAKPAAGGLSISSE